jgi:hypothetical protein
MFVLMTKLQTGKVCVSNQVFDGSVRDKMSVSSILDNRTYNVEFTDERCDEYTLNIVDQNMYSQCDEEGYQFVMM